MSAPWLKKEKDCATFNGDGELIYFVPERFFDSEKIAVILGNQVSFFGICNYAVFDKNGKSITGLKPFNFPTIFSCEPSDITKEKGIILKRKPISESTDVNIDEPSEIPSSDPDSEFADDNDVEYRCLHFRKGDKLFTSLRVPQTLENVEYFFKLAFITAKIPTTIPYNELQNLFVKNGDLNSFSYNLNMQMFGFPIGEICRSKSDISKPFRLTKNKNMHDYRPISLKISPKFVSPYASITSENIDQAIMGATTTESNIPSPLEKVLTM